MSQFRVYRNARGSRGEVPYLVDVQSDLVQTGSRMMVPLVRADRYGPQYTRLNPTFVIDNVPVVAAVSDLAAVDERELREQVADLAHARHEILAAIDFLLTGY